MSAAAGFRDYFDRPLLERYRPQLRYDKQEPYRTIAAESICDNPRNLLLAKDGAVIARANGHDGLALTIDVLSNYPTGLTPENGDRLDEANDVLADARELQNKERYADRVYGRVVEKGDGKWLQYWFWLYYNPKNLLGYGEHEGDWEMVQLKLDSHDEPMVLTYAQHSHAERKAFQNAESDRSDGGRHCVVYVAPFSHASYFEKGTHFYGVGTDNPDGEEVAPLPKVEPFDKWADWPGRWGNSRGISFGPIKTKVGRSPEGPARQRGRWCHPDSFEQDAEERRPRRKRLLWQLGRTTFPAEPIISARIEGQEAVVDYNVKPDWRKAPSQLLLTVHDASKPGNPIVFSHAVRVPEPRGEAHLPLPYVPGRTLVRASSFNPLRQRSDVADAPAEVART